MYEIKYEYDIDKGEEAVVEAYRSALRIIEELGAEDFTIRITRKSHTIHIQCWKLWLPIDEPLFGTGPVPGWLSESDKLAITHLSSLLPMSGVLVEVGSFLGKSSVEWANNFKNLNKNYEIISIDHYNLPITNIHKLLTDSDYPIPPGQDQLELFKYYTKDYKNIIPLQALFNNQFRFFRKVNLVFEDSDHEISTLNHGLPFWWDLLLPGGILAGHDWDLPQVRQVVSTFAICNNLEVKQLFDSKIWFIQKDN